MAVQEQGSLASTDRHDPDVLRATEFFVRMWAIAHVIHLVIANGYSLSSPSSIAVVTLAFMTLLKPGSGRLVLLLGLFQITDYVVEMPRSPDHWALVALVNAAILLTMAVSRSTSIATINAALPAARISLLIAYGAAALAKWNVTYLDPVTSCANALAGQATFRTLPSLTDSVVVTYATIAAESFVVLLLLIPATRWCGVALGLTFHFTLSASPAIQVSDFTSTVFALFILFLPMATRTRIVTGIARVTSRSAIVRDLGRHPWLTAVCAFATLGFSGYASAPVAALVGYALAQVYLGTILVAALRAALTTRRSSTIGRVRAVHIPVLVLVLLWALNPYLGLRTTGVFTMFSNLRTESPAPNHIFMPSVRVAAWQDEMLTIESSNDPDLRTLRRNALGTSKSLALPMVAIRRRAMDDPELVVTGTMDGESVTYGPEPGQRHLSPLPGWQYKVFLMRAVPTDGRLYCSN